MKDNSTEAYSSPKIKIRFGDLVRNSGRPQVVTLWTEPAKDPTVSRAIREHRILSVSEAQGKRPYGAFGLHPGPHTLMLVFPRPLPQESDARVIGINYQLLEEPDLKASVSGSRLRPNAKRRSPKP